MYQFLAKGGPLMIPIIGGFVLGLAIIIERFINLRYYKIVNSELFLKVKEYISDGKFDLALNYVRKNANSVVKPLLIEAIENRDLPEEDLKELIETVGKKSTKMLEKNLATLSTIVSIEPLLGLLGTVTGMIKVFAVISAKGLGHADLLAKGISQALITTAAGLSIAIPFLIFYNIFNEKVENIIIELETEIFSIFKNLK